MMMIVLMIGLTACALNEHVNFINNVDQEFSTLRNHIEHFSKKKMRSIYKEKKDTEVIRVILSSSTLIC